MRPALPAALALAAALVASSACDCRAVVTPVSSAVDDVRVSVAGPGGFCGSTVGVGSIEVYRGASRETAWIASLPATDKGYPALSEVRYGVLPPGFVEERKPAELKPGDELWFQVHGPSFRGEARIVVTPAR